MDGALYQSAKQKIEQRFAKATEEAKANYEADMVALDRVWPLLQSCEQEKPSAGNGTVVDADGHATDAERGEITKAVRVAVDELAGRDFTRKDVDEILAQGGLFPNKSTVAHILKKLEEDGYIRVILRGEGRRPTSYRTEEIDSDL